MGFYNHCGTGTVILLRLEIVVYLKIRGLKQSFSPEKMTLFGYTANKCILQLPQDVKSLINLAVTQILKYEQEIKVNLWTWSGQKKYYDVSDFKC